MKIKQLSIRNIGLHEDTVIPIDKPLILFVGDLRQGKTSILNSVKWCMGGSYPSDIIRHGEDEASVTLEFENGSITREWYRTKAGPTTDRPIVFVRDGKPVKGRVVDEIKKLLNPYLLDSEHLLHMSERERKEYFVQLFGVDTSDLDAQAKQAEADARDLRAKIKGYGVIDVTPVEVPNVEAVKQQLQTVRDAHQKALDEHKGQVKIIRDSHQEASRAVTNENILVSKHNSQVDRVAGQVVDDTDEIKRLQARIGELQAAVNERTQWLKDNPVKAMIEPPAMPEEPPAPEPPDTWGLEAKISQGEADKVRYEAYQAALKRLEAKAVDEKALSDLEARQREIKKQKIAQLKAINTGGIKDLSFDEDGNFIYEGTQASMLSTSQIMQLSSALSSLYPAGFGLELIDRAESLGKSIFTFIERAAREEKSILAAIVGESPADVPENVGVWVVEQGHVKPNGYVWCSKVEKRVPKGRCEKCEQSCEGCLNG